MNHAAARMPKVVTDTLLWDHGDTDTRPSPAPSMSKASDSAEATTAPAIIAGQETAEPDVSPPSAREMNVESVMAISDCSRND
jgi:hypothetical protein